MSCLLLFRKKKKNSEVHPPVADYGQWQTPFIPMYGQQPIQPQTPAPALSPTIAPGPTPQYMPRQGGRQGSMNIGVKTQGGDYSADQFIAPQPKKRKKRCRGLRCSWLFIFMWIITTFIFLVGLAVYLLGFYAFYKEQQLVEYLYPNGKGKMDGFNQLGLLKKSGEWIMWTGFAIGVLGFFGCFGIFCENVYMVKTFGWLVLLSVIIQIIIVLTLVIAKQKIFDTMESTLKSTLRTHYDGRLNSTNDLSILMDTFMILNECCGISGPSDFVDTTWYKNRTNPQQTVPFSCCKLGNTHGFFQGGAPTLEDPNCTYVNYSDSRARLPAYVGSSCMGNFQKLLSDKATTLTQVTIVVLVLQSTAVCWARTAATRIREHNELQKTRRLARVRRGLSEDSDDD